MFDLVLWTGVLMTFYILSLFATQIVFSNGDGIDVRRMLVIAPLAPITFYGALTAAWVWGDALLALLIFISLFYLSLQVIKRQSMNPGYTLRAASRVFSAILWRVVLLGFGLRAILEISAYIFAL